MNARPRSSQAGRRLFAGIACGVAALLAASGCGSSSDSKDSGTGGGNSTVRITTLGLCNEIPVFWAQEKGIFAKNNVTVELVKSTGGAAALTALQSGDIDLAFTNPFSTMIAISQGIDLKWIATAYETTNDEGQGTNAIAVAKDSGITDAKSLNGKTVGVNEIGGINQIITVQWMTMKGGDPSTVKFVALPFNELASAVASGKVAAAQVPAQNVDPNLGLHSLGDPYVAVGNGKPLTFAGYVAVSKKSTSYEKQFKAFQQSLIEADQQINLPENSDAKFAMEAKNCKQDVNVLKKLHENIYEARVDTASLQRMGVILKDQSRVKEPAKPADFVPSYVVTK
ncbi:ABC transporter substrate-binding protein [Dactylosporangium salmoneum]|uniref:Solute-binding protein family 3/N-terminal domain-containing protein n=1 Tax=Dactylosporangium salmoneum TaxID=53361 RepID=A0ABP5V977_9ACTN